MGVFLKNYYHDPDYVKTSSILNKNRKYFQQIFRQKYFKNHDIGPWRPGREIESRQKNKVDKTSVGELSPRRSRKSRDATTCPPRIFFCGQETNVIKLQKSICQD
jgi:hypothetical protein